MMKRWILKITLVLIPWISKAEANHFVAALLEAGIVQYIYAELCTYSGSQKSSLFCFCTFIYLFFPISGEDFDEDLNQSDG